MLYSWHVKFKLLTFDRNYLSLYLFNNLKLEVSFPAAPLPSLHPHLCLNAISPTSSFSLSHQLSTELVWPNSNLGSIQPSSPRTTLWAAEHHCGKITHGLLVSNLHCPLGALACRLPGHTLSYSPPGPPPSEKTNVFRWEAPPTAPIKSTHLLPLECFPSTLLKWNRPFPYPPNSPLAPLAPKFPLG